MKLFFIILSTLCYVNIASAGHLDPFSSNQYETIVKNIIDYTALTYNTGFQFALKHKEYAFEYAGGVQNHETGAKMKTSDMIPLGSLTKIFTAASLGQQIEKGVMGWNDTLIQWANDIIKNDVGLYLEELFNPIYINEVTLYHLAFMQSGIDDYDDNENLKKIMENPKHDQTPADYLTSYDGSFICAPGTCHRYSSLNYLLLQYAIAAASGAKTMDDYDEMVVFPKHLRSQFNRTKFINHGLCSDYEDEGVARTYKNMSKNTWPATEIFYKDFSKFSCANGFGMGNIAINAGDAANFLYNYLGTENIIKNDTLDVILDFFKPGIKRTDKYGMSKYAYGGGLMWMTIPIRDNEQSSDWRKNNAHGGGVMWSPKSLRDDEESSDWRKNTMIGHGGMDYASQTLESGYNFAYKFSLVLSQNVQDAISCDQSYQTGEGEDGPNAGNLLVCLIEDLTFQLFSNGTNPRFNCTEQKYALSEHGKEIIKIAHDPTYRFTKVATKSEVQSLKSALHCHPYCHECFSGICHQCKKCQGGKKNSKCKQCYNGEKPCLSIKKDKCEICWGLKTNKKNLKKVKKQQKKKTKQMKAKAIVGDL